MQRRQLLLVFGLGLAVILSAIGVTWTEFESRSQFQKLQALRAERDEVDTTWKKLTIERSTWATPDRVERIAREELGMVIPPTEQVVILYLD